jgi:hypothetical protein
VKQETLFLDWLFDNGGLEVFVKHFEKKYMKQEIEDPIVVAVMTKFYERSKLGIQKYGTTLERDDLNAIEWLNHAQDEVMDLCLYLERLKREIRGKLLIELMNEGE